MLLSIDNGYPTLEPGKASLPRAPKDYEENFSMPMRCCETAIRKLGGVVVEAKLYAKFERLLNSMGKQYSKERFHLFMRHCDSKNEFFRYVVAISDNFCADIFIV